MERKRENLFECEDSSFISVIFVCDGFEDCRNGGDENGNQCNRNDSLSEQCDDLQYIDVKYLFNICPYNSSFSYKPGIPRVPRNYHCIFILNDNNMLTPYENGQHLTECDKHACNSSFYKCPGFYCIPWQYVCNNQIDCPGGLEEKDCNKQLCLLQFKCRDSAICVDLESVCDAIIDCPFRDDEYFCDIFLENCPMVCTCQLYITGFLTVRFTRGNVNTVT